MNKMKKNIEELRWVRIFTVDPLPHYLLDQIKNRTYSIEEFFKYHQMNLLIQGKDGIILNPFNHLHVLVSPENLVKGFLWMTIDPLTKDIFIQTYSVDKEYWGKGLAVKKVSKYVQDIQKKGKLNKIFWITRYEKHSMRYGFKRSSSILMEYDPNEEVKKEKQKEEIKKEEDNGKLEKAV